MVIELQDEEDDDDDISDDDDDEFADGEFEDVEEEYADDDNDALNDDVETGDADQEVGDNGESEDETHNEVKDHDEDAQSNSESELVGEKRESDDVTGLTDEHTIKRRKTVEESGENDFDEPFDNEINALDAEANDEDEDEDEDVQVIGRDRKMLAEKHDPKKRRKRLLQSYYAQGLFV